MDPYVIFLNGEWHLPDVGCRTLDSVSFGSHYSMAKTMYVADGGARWLPSPEFAGHKIVWAGDGDSLPSSFHSSLSQTEKCILAPTQKDQSDFSFLLDEVFDSCQESPFLIEVFAGLGGRKDHEQANLWEAASFLKRSSQKGTFLFHGGVLVTSAAVWLSPMQSRLFSVFAIQGSRVTIEGAQYSGLHTLSRPSHGLSNVGCAHEVGVDPHKAIVFVYWNP